ncbi:MAG: hypothetical protein ACREF0_04660, partial [Acetobacteraceae bacterium]
MPAARQRPDLLARHVGGEGAGLGILAEEFFPDISAVLAFEILVLAVHAFFHALLQHPRGIARQKLIPARAPDHLDDVPAGAAELRFEVLDDLAVAAHRSVQPLEIAVDDEDRVVEPFTRGHPDRAQT